MRDDVIEVVLLERDNKYETAEVRILHHETRRGLDQDQYYYKDYG